jgi:cyanophycinase-like exopeptidase
MTQAGPLQGRPGAGWLILLGGGRWEENETIHSQAISAILDESPIAFIPAADPDPVRGEAFLSFYADLGAPHGYVVPIHDQQSANDPANYRRLANASLIYIGGGSLQRLLEAVDGTHALDALAAAFDGGAVIVGEGAGAMLLGKWGVSARQGKIYPGWGWVSDALIVPHYTTERTTQVRAALQHYPEAIALGIPDGVALALGPDGELATWTDTDLQVTVTLGPKFGR